MYEYDVSKIISDIQKDGYARLPSIRELVQKHKIYDNFISECADRTYSENSETQNSLLKLLNLSALFNALYDLGKNQYDLKIDKDDRYFIARKVNPGQSSEGYRGHFDSHLFTLVLPIKIPERNYGAASGQLIVVPSARKRPKSEIKNMLQKLFWKRYSNKEGFAHLLKRPNSMEVNFYDYSPILFNGMTTFHGNRPLENAIEPRLSMLCHLYDPSPKYGIGYLLRKIRNR